MAIEYTLLCDLAHVQVELAKMVSYIGLLPNFGACSGGNSENSAVNIFPAYYKEYSII